MKKISFAILILMILSFSGCNTAHTAVQSDLRFPLPQSQAQIEKAEWEESQDRFENDLLEINN